MTSVPLHRRTFAKVVENSVLRNGHPSRRRFGGAVRDADRFSIATGNSLGGAHCVIHAAASW